jgi:hypothetical protein
MIIKVESIYKCYYTAKKKGLGGDPCGLIKRKWGEAQALEVRLQNSTMKVENVVQDQISFINLNH